MPELLSIPLHVRPMTQKDVPIVANIAQSVMPFAWSQQSFYDCLAPDYHAFVIVQGEQGLANQLLGFIVVLNQVGESQLLAMGLRQKCQRQGLGRQLLLHTIALAKQQQLTCMWLEVRASNQAAIALYASVGFKQVGVRRSYYPAKDGREDAMVMKLVF